MHLDALRPSEQRVLGCLIEKRFTTPDQYPLSLNALRLACNQATNREPVTDYDESTIREAAQRLSRYGLARLASGHNSRSIKYRHLAEEALGLDRPELAVLSVLLLRGAQTPGELQARTERTASLASLTEVERVLEGLGQRGYARRLDRRPGQKEDRFEQLLGGRGHGDGDGPGVHVNVDVDGPAVSPGSAPPAVRTPEAADGGLADRVAALEAALTELKAELRKLGGERQTHEVGGATHDHAGERHLESGGPP